MFRLADSLAHKYGLVSTAAEPPTLQEVLRDVESNVKNAFRNYIDLKTITSKAYNAIPIFAHQGEPHCQKIVGHMQFITANINTLLGKPARLFKEINKVLALITSLVETIKNTKKKSPEVLPNEQVRNSTNNDLSRLENSLKRFSSLMVQSASLLQPFAKKLGDDEEDTALQGEVVVPEAKPLTKNERRQFFLMYPNEAAEYGFTSDLVGNLDVLQKFLEESGMSVEFDKFVRAIKGKGNPENGNLIKAWTKQIKASLPRQTNVSALEGNPTLETEERIRQLQNAERIKREIKEERDAELKEEYIRRKEEEYRRGKF